jgi:acyl-CoA thioester hydrolase
MYTHRTPYRVIYGDTDNMGVAYYANYLRWFEIGRTEMFRELGMAYSEIESRGLLLPVSEAHCKYMAPARYDELLFIDTSLDPTLRAGMKFDYRISADDGNRVLAEGYTKHACMDPSGRVIRPPNYLKQLIQEITAK